MNIEHCKPFSSIPTLARPAFAPSDDSSGGQDPREEATSAGISSRYRIGRRLGAGGMAEVFVACRNNPDGTDQPVVIKRPLPHLACHPEFLTMFIDEVRIASTLHHPNVVRVEEFVQEGGTCFMVMELVDGRSLSSVLGRSERRGQRLGSRWAAFVVARIAAGLHYAHTRTDQAGQALQIVHRDVSPQNVLVSFDGEVKVIDFGIARALDRATRTRTGTRKGKTGYMAPEQAKGGGLDHRVDVFGLGIILWEALCGRRLFLRPDEFRTMNALLIDPIPAPSSLAAVPPELERITLRALARNPDERYQSAEALRRDLDAFVASVGGANPAELGEIVRTLFSEEPSLLTEAVPPEIAPAVITNPTVAVLPPDQRRRQALLLGLGAVAAAGVGLALGWVGKRVGTKAVTSVVAGAARSAETTAASARLPAPAPGEGSPAPEPPIAEDEPRALALEPAPSTDGTGHETLDSLRGEEPGLMAPPGAKGRAPADSTGEDQPRPRGPAPEATARERRRREVSAAQKRKIKRIRLSPKTNPF